ncbi:uncharacterized protein LOC129226484 [Uloborus diversus]|uniref:uncharacterized protein LOC129226484 n=1 Tax=Uloborus diversus TaxID=327109 RepID=UPI002409FE83|nr:uncharacterized protein LOC129226484 [Uloborus diversus]
MFFRTSSLRAVLLATLLLGLSVTIKGHNHHRKGKLDEDLFLNALVEDDLEKDVEDSSGDEDISDCDSLAVRRNTDEYVDRVLREVRPKIPELFPLPERTGRFRLFNGSLTNLRTMRRTGPAMVRCTDSTLSFLVPIGFRNLTGSYFWETDTGVPVFRGLINVFAGDVEADVMYSRLRNQAAEREDSTKATVDNLRITKLEGVRVSFDGLGVLNRFASRLSNLVARFFSRAMSRAIEGPLKNMINKELKDVDKYEKYYF